MTHAEIFSHSSAGEAGFTLLELLIAMTLLGLLTVALFAGLKFGTRVWAASETATAGANKVNAIQMLLSREIARAYPLFVTKDVTDAHVEFDGTERTITFLGPDPRGSGAMLRISALASGGENTATLKIVARPELSNVRNDATMAELHGLRFLEFAYFGAEDAKTAPAWHAVWQNEKRLPTLIRIRAAFARGTHTIWPALVIAPRISADSGCTIDLLTKDCRGR